MFRGWRLEGASYETPAATLSVRRPELLLDLGHPVGDAYFGVGGSFFFLVPLLSIQAGKAVSNAAELRTDLDTLVAANLLGGDVLYTLLSYPSVKIYLGAGPDFIFFPGLGGGFDFHATAGVEYGTGEGFGL